MKDVALFLFDVSGIMAMPWLDAGYECWIVDIQHPVAYDTEGITKQGGLVKVHADLTKPWLPPREIIDRVAFVGAFPPCDHLSVSGARWFKGKGLRKLETSVAMFATAAEIVDFFDDAPGFLENPVSTMATYWRKPQYSFHPHFFTGYNIDDNYTKATNLWANEKYVMPEKFIAEGLAKPDDRIHKCPPSADRHNIRSATPYGFAKANFESNGRHLAKSVA